MQEHETPQEIQKIGSEKLDGQWYWIMSDDSRQPMEEARVRLEDTLKKPGKEPRVLAQKSRLDPPGVIYTHELHVAEAQAKLLGEGQLGEGDRATERAAALGDAISITNDAIEGHHQAEEVRRWLGKGVGGADD